MVDIQLTVVEAGISMRTYMGSWMEIRRSGDYVRKPRNSRARARSRNSRTIYTTRTT
jgi:lipocalin